MKVISVNLGLPRKIIYNKQKVTTSIFKDPIRERVKLREMNLDGDKQSDLTVHGGVDKAVYSYPWSTMINGRNIIRKLIYLLVCSEKTLLLTD